MIDEGYIKFQCHWIKAPPLRASQLKALQYWRAKLFALGLIGAYENGIGYGNISERNAADQFIISGSATGNLAKMVASHYAKVTQFDLESNALTCEGPVKASSESMTHGALYRLDSQIGAVIHVHHLQLWNELLDKVPTSDKEVPYGTPEMALEIVRLFNETDLPQKRILAMAGHREGIVTFGEDLNEAGKVLMDYCSTL